MLVQVIRHERKRPTPDQQLLPKPPTKICRRQRAYNACVLLEFMSKSPPGKTTAEFLSLNRSRASNDSIGSALAIHRRDASGRLARGRPKRMEIQLALMLAQEVEKPLVVIRGHVECLHQPAVVPPRLEQALAHEGADIVARQIAPHEGPVDGRPERFAAIDHAFEQILGA